MTKFKVGDRVTLSGTVVEVDKSDWAPYGIKFDGGTRTVWFSDDATPEKAPQNDGLTFRDQAAIAAFQALHSNAACNGWGYEQIAISSLKYAEALDAERKKINLLDEVNSVAVSDLDRLTAVGERQGYKNPRAWAEQVAAARKKRDGE